MRRLVVFSRDELKQYEMAQQFPSASTPACATSSATCATRSACSARWRGVDIVVHAAALKQVPTAEYNPFECIKTNVLGAERHRRLPRPGVKRVVALSTDKAAAPINLYGATKLCSDKLFVAANNIKGRRDARFSVVRYGGVMGSRGSVIPFLLLAQRAAGTLPITDPTMTRFNISLQEGVEMVLWALANAHGGEILVPKIPSYRITDVASAIGPNCRQTIVGVRPGEKIHEEMITASDSLNTVDLGAYYAILPSAGAYSVDDYVARTGAARARGLQLRQRRNPTSSASSSCASDLLARLRPGSDRHAGARGRPNGLRWTRFALQPPGDHRGRHRRGERRCCAPDLVTQGPVVQR